MKLYALTAGYVEHDKRIFVPSAPKGMRVQSPLPFFLIVHPKGNVLFDTGIHPDAISDAARRWAGLEKVFAPRLRPGDDAVSQLARLDLGAGDVDLVINSHLHFDHAGANQFFPAATLVVNQREWDAAHDEAEIKKNSFLPMDYDHPLQYRFIDGEYDVFGDGRVVVFPTFGHTPGHQSLRLDLQRAGTLILAADSCYMLENLEQCILPRVSWSDDENQASIQRLHDLHAGGKAKVIVGHDLRAWVQLPSLPEFLD